jgi:hypothetical protein
MGRATVAPARSRLLLVAGWFALAGVVLEDLLRAVKHVLQDTVGSVRVRWEWSNVDYLSVRASEIVGPLIAVGVGVAGWKLSRARNGRMWAGAGLLAGTGLFYAGWIPYQADLRGELAEFGFDRKEVFLLGRIAVAVAGALAIVAIIRHRPPARFGRPARPGWTAVLVATTVVAITVYLTVTLFDWRPQGTFVYLVNMFGALALTCWRGRSRWASGWWAPGWPMRCCRSSPGHGDTSPARFTQNSGTYWTAAPNCGGPASSSPPSARWSRRSWRSAAGRPDQRVPSRATRAARRADRRDVRLRRAAFRARHRIGGGERGGTCAATPNG